MINFRFSALGLVTLSSSAYLACLFYQPAPAAADPLDKSIESSAEAKNETKKQSRREPAKDSSADNKMTAHPTLPGSEINRHDPLAIYREAGIDKEQETKIRQLAKDFEEGQRVRLALIGNLLKDMRNLQMQPDPNEKIVLAKQDEINKVQAEMGTERTKLVLKIRNVLDFEQKQRLIQNMKPTAHTPSQ